MVQNLLLNILLLLIWMIFIEILKNTIQTEIDDVISDMLSNKKLNPIVTELFIRGRKLNVSCFYYTILFRCSKNISLNTNTILLWKFQTKKNYNKLCLIILKILTFKTLWIFMKVYCKTIFIFCYWYYSYIR